jgi:cell division protease FtsH
VSVSYSPWFLDQVEKDNILNLTISGTEVHGELRKEQKYKAPSTSQFQNIKRFTTYIPSDQSATPLAEKVREISREGKNEEARVEILQPQTANGLRWITLLLPTFVIIGLIYFMMRKARRG